MSTHPINIDDADINDIQYLTADLWSHQNGKPGYHNGTFSGGLTNALAEYRFNGTSVMVYGVASPRPSGQQSAIPPSMTFSIDDGIPIPVVSNPDLQTTEFAHQFFDSHTLSPGEHVLHLNVTHGEAKWPFVLDYILYSPLDPGSQPGPNTAGTSAEGSSSHTGAIVAGVVVGFALLLAALLYWYYKRRARVPLIRAVRKGGNTTLDLLEDGCKLPPPSPVLTGESGVESVAAYTPPELPSPSHVTSFSMDHQHPPTMAPGHRGSLYDVGSEFALNLSHSPPQSPPPTPAISLFSSVSGAPTRASTTLQAVLAPPEELDWIPEEPQISYRPATPSESPYALSEQARLDSGPSGSGTTRRSAKIQLLREQKRATFHSDSGVRFKAGQTVPVDVEGPLLSPHPPLSPPSPQPQPPPPPSEASEIPGTSLMEWKQRQKKQKRASFEGSAISEVPPMYTPN